MGLEIEPFDVADYLTDAESIAIYLTDALESGNPDEFTDALADVARARGGLNQLVAETGLSMQTLQSAFDHASQPDLPTIFKILQALGMRLTTTAAVSSELAA